MERMSSGQEMVLSRDEALEIITFLISSAEICLHEPRYYGTFRLIDGASRMIEAMLGHESTESSAFLKAF